MAQIKNIKKPGDLIRGAKVGVAGLDKDGNVVGTGIAVEDVPVYPEGAQSGDVLAWGGETGAEWRPHYPEDGNEGDVLTLGETGPEWAPPGGGSDVIYRHLLTAFTAGGNQSLAFRFDIINRDPTPFTANTIVAYLLSHELKEVGTKLGVTGNVWDGVESSNTLYIANRLQNVVGEIRVYVNNTKSAETSATLTSMPGLVDNVLTI